MSLKSFVFATPTKIKYGPGVAESVGEEVKGFNAKRVLIVTDKGIIKAGLVDKVLKSLKATKLDTVVFDEVEPNPKDRDVEKGAALAKEKGIDLIVAVGGGSVMDSAKGIGSLVTNKGSLRDYWGLDTLSKPPLPLIAIPTTAGTGSEITMWAVIDDTSRKRVTKEYIGGRLICPSLALVDPLMTKNLPPKLTASTGMDALTHAIEAYTSIPASPLTDALALYSIRLIANNLGKAYANGDNLEARDNMMVASLMAGLAFSNSDTAGVHVMAETAGGLYDCPHGIACAVFLPYVMEYNLIANPEKFADIAEAMEENVTGLSIKEASRKSVDAVKKLLLDIDITLNAAKLGVRKEDIAWLAKKAAANIGAIDNPRKLREEDFIKMFELAMG